VEVLHIIIYKLFVPNLPNLKFSYYNHSSGVALVTLLQPPKRSALHKSQTFYSSSLTAKTVMQQGPKQTCNKGLTNPEYKSTPQDLIDEKSGEDLAMQA
jgi:hypothetical protein